MKKIMSVFTSAVMALCIISVFLTAAVTSSEEEKNILTAGTVVDKSFEGVTAELDGDAIRFITEYPEILVGTEKEISISRTEDGYLFRPMGDGKYVVLIIYYPPVAIPLYETFWFPPVEAFAYEIEVVNNVVNFNAVHWSYEKMMKNSLRALCLTEHLLQLRQIWAQSLERTILSYVSVMNWIHCSFIILMKVRNQQT